MKSLVLRSLTLSLLFCLLLSSAGKTSAKKTHRSPAQTGTTSTPDAEIFVEDLYEQWRSYDDLVKVMRDLYTKAKRVTSKLHIDGDEGMLKDRVDKFVQFYSIGKTAERRDIKVLSIGAQASTYNAHSQHVPHSHLKRKKTKKKIKQSEMEQELLDGTERNEAVLLGGMHGREWPAIYSVLYACSKFIAFLEELHESSPASAGIASNEVFKLLDEHTFHFLPILNPDGYEYTFQAFLRDEKQDEEHPVGGEREFSSLSASSARLWRKNRRNLCSKSIRQSSQGKKCAHGIDLNRNFGVEGVSWGFGNSKATTEVFQGRKPFSEPESKAMLNWLTTKHPTRTRDGGEGEMRNLASKINVFLDVHCCSAAVLAPFDYKHLSMSAGESSVETREGSFSHKAPQCKRMADAMGNIQGYNKYQCRDRETQFSESNTGIFVDWLSNELDIPNVYIVETRGNKNKKMERIFQVSREVSQSIGEEVHEAFRTILQSAANIDMVSMSMEQKADVEPVERDEPVQELVQAEINLVEDVIEADVLLHMLPVGSKEETNPISATTSMGAVEMYEPDPIPIFQIESINQEQSPGAEEMNLEEIEALLALGSQGSGGSLDSVEEIPVLSAGLSADPVDTEKLVDAASSQQTLNLDFEELLQSEDDMDLVETEIEVLSFSETQSDSDNEPQLEVESQSKFEAIAESDETMNAAVGALQKTEPILSEIPEKFSERPVLTSTDFSVMNVAELSDFLDSFGGIDQTSVAGLNPEDEVEDVYIAALELLGEEIEEKTEAIEGPESITTVFKSFQVASDEPGQVLLPTQTEKKLLLITIFFLAWSFLLLFMRHRRSGIKETISNQKFTHSKGKLSHFCLQYRDKWRLPLTKSHGRSD